MLEKTQEHSSHADQFSVRLEMKSNELDLHRTRNIVSDAVVMLEEQRCAADEAHDPTIEHSSLCVCRYRPVLRIVTVICERRNRSPPGGSTGCVEVPRVMNRASDDQMHQVPKN